jgi:hypothetical protein
VKRIASADGNGLGFNHGTDGILFMVDGINFIA